MNLDEAIQHCEEVAEEKEEDVIIYHNCATYNQNLYEKELAENTEKECRACADEHRQLADWLKELKAYKEQDSNAISKLGMQHILNHEVKWINERMTKEQAQDVESFDRAIKELDEKSCEMTADEYRQRMIQAFHNTDCDELIAICVLPTEKEFEHLEWLLKSHYKKEPCEDAISRQAVAQVLLKYAHSTEGKAFAEFLISQINDLPPVSPQQRTGRWIPLEYDGYADGNPVWDKWECSKCGWEHSGDEESLTAFCPNCGAKMEVEE